MEAKSQMTNGLFISGTDTGIGKTLVSSLLVAALGTYGRAHGFSPGYFKPIQTGTDLDTETVGRLSGISGECLPNPTYQFALPAAPSRAAEHEGAEIHLGHVVKHWISLSEFSGRRWVVEGAGGLLVPVNKNQTIRDLICALKIPLLLVASTRLGTINHTLLSLEAARLAGISLKGIVLVGESDSNLDEVLTSFSGVPVVTQIPILNSVTPEAITALGAEYFSENVLRSLYEF